MVQCSFLAIFLCFLTWYLISVHRKEALSNDQMRIMFFWLKVSVEIFFFYYLLTFINKTSIKISADRLIVKNGPIPTFWMPVVDLSSSDIDQLFFKRIIDGELGHIYQLIAITQSQQQIKLLNFIQSPEEAFFIELQLEKFLNIKHRKISTEYSG